MTAEEFGRRMTDNIGTPGDGLAEIGRGERVVDDERDAGLMRDGCTGSRSTTMPPGLARFSRKIALQRGVSAFLKFCGSVGSTKCAVQPNFLKVWENCVIEPP